MSVKRVFAIIGIVLGAVTAFVGAVLGVMAAMGKFKTPVVKPEKIYFENAEQVIVAQYKDDLGKDVIYSFMLKGENNSIDYDVNVKDCFIWFEKGVGEDLIQLCDKDGKSLQADAKKRYAIKCNETIYYKLKEVDENVAPDLTSDLNGKVVLRARTADDQVQTKEDLIIWVDRNITSIFLDYGDEPNATNEPVQQQRINIGVDYEVEFDYIVNPEISWQPISKESKKIVELYYDDPKTEDFVLVNIENINNEVAYSLNKIFDKTKCQVDPVTGELKLTFLSSEITNGTPHYFKLAVFPSYNARAEFLADENNLSVTNVQRLESMVVTDLYIEVVNTSVDNVSMSDGVINLMLYTNNNQIHLKNSDADKNNLNIEMQSAGETFNIRLDEVSLNAMSSRFYGTPKFVKEITQEGVLNEINFADYTVENYNGGSTIKLKAKSGGSVLEFDIAKSITIDNYQIINKLTNANGNYYCKNGIALINDEKNVKLLNVGSYLDFYVYNSDERTYTLATEDDIKYSFETKERDKNSVKAGDSKKYWEIVVESVRTLSSNENLVLGLLVANNDGKFVVENLFKTKGVSVNEENLSYTVTNSLKTLDVISSVINYSPSEVYDFNHFINVTAGTYNACVLAIPENEIFKIIDGTNTNVSVVEYVNAYYEKDGVKYYIVGYLDDDNNFVNKVKALNNANVTKLIENKLKLLQLKNGFGETAEEFISKLINNVDISTDPLIMTDFNVKSLINETITVKQNLLVDDTIEFNVEVDDLEENPTGLYSGTNNHKIEITANNDTILARLVNFYKIDVNSVGADSNEDDVYIVNNYVYNANITSVVYDDNVKTLTINFNVGEMLNSDVNVEIGLVNMFASETNLKTLYAFKIFSSEPSEIRYYYGDDTKYLTLTEERDDDPFVTAKITWDEVNKKYITEWFVGDVEDGITLGNSFELNTNLAKNTYAGFQDPEFKVSHNITYGILGDSIVNNKNNLEVINSEDAYLSVTIFGVTRYLKIKIDTSNFVLEQISDIIEGDTGVLSEIVSYKYVAQSIFDSDLIELSNLNLLYTNSIPGKIEIEPTKNLITFTYNFDDEALTDLTLLTIERKIENGKTDWVFSRINAKQAALKIVFDVATKTGILKNVTINFEQDITHELNAISWGAQPKLYKDTKIILYEVATKDANGEYSFETEPLIKIRNKTEGNTITIENSAGTELENVLTLSNDSYTFVIYNTKGGDKIEIDRYSFEVVPNLIVKQNTTENLVLNSGSGSEGVFDTTVHANPEDELKGYVKLYQYANDIVYGAKEAGGDNIVLYSSEGVLVDKTQASDGFIQSVTFESEDNMITKTSGVATATTGWLNNIGSEKEVDVTVKSGEDVVGTFKAIVKNNYQVTTNNANIVGNVLNIKAMTDINEWLSVSGFTITEIKWKYSTADENKTFEITTGNKYEIPSLNIKYENVTLILTLEGTGANVGKTLIFEGKNINRIEDLTINIVPYELETLADINALSENNFNLLKGVYNTTDIATYFEYIKIISVKDKDGNTLTLSNLGYAYNSENPTSGLEVTFNKISGDEISAFITYEVKFVGDLVYTYVKEIPLKNKQQLIVEHPENATELSLTEIVLINSVTGTTETHTDVKFEPVLVNKITGATINLLKDDTKFVNRIKAISRVDNPDKNVSELTLSEVENVVVLAYDQVFGMSAYATQVAASIIEEVDKTTIKFPAGTVSGVIAFRLYVKSGNYADYYVYVTSLGNKTEVSSSQTESINYEYTDSTKTISDIAKTIDLEDKFKIEDVSKLKFFLLNAKTLADINNSFNTTIFGAGVNQYTCVNDKTLIISEFTTITLSLIYDDDHNIYPVGILKLYLRPTGAVTTDSASPSYIGDGYSSNYHNGEFAYTIEDANATEVPYPTTDFVFKSEQNDAKDIVDYDDANHKLTIRDKVTSDYKFTVFYTHNTKNYTIKVTYTYKHVEIKTADAEKSDIVGELKSGEYDETSGKELSSFDNTVVIDSTYYVAHFGTYQGEIKIGGATFTVGAGAVFSGAESQTIAEGVEYNINDNASDGIQDGALVLTFEQGLYDEEKQINVVYNNLSDNALKTQTYTFTVKRGLEIITNSNEGGVVSGQRKTTDLVANSFTSPTGSKLEITKTPTNDGVKYSFAGYTIYVKGSSSKLVFNFAPNIEKYALSDAQNATTKVYEQEVSDIATLDFVHLAQSVNVDLTFTISNGTNNFKSNETDTDIRNLYLTLPRTYLGVEAVYSTIAYNTGKDDAEGNDIVYAPTAENIVKGTTISDFVKYLFKLSETGDIIYPTGVADPSMDSYLANAIKIKLKKLDGSYFTDAEDKYIDFSAMGFVDSNNPNFLTFTIQDGGKISYTNSNAGIALPNAISVNEICKLYLSNTAGMSTFEYAIQIMADTKVDGITFSDAGFEGDSNDDDINDYMSFTIADNNSSQIYNTGRLKIGSIKDTASSGVWVKIGTGSTDEDWKFLPKAGTEIERTATYHDNTYKIILEIDPYNNSVYNLYMIYYRNSTGAILGNTTIVQPKIHGTSGYILDGGFSIVLINANVKGNDNRETGIMGGEKIDLTGKVGSTNADRLTLPDNAVLSVNWNQSRYGTGALSNVFDSEGSNLVTFAYEGTKPMLTTYTVGESVRIKLAFEVKIGSYYVKNITYQFQIDRSVQFFFNSNNVLSGWVPENASGYSTNFVMTNSTGESGATARSFDLEFSFGSPVLDGEKKKTVDGKDYFTSLNWMIKDAVGSSVTAGVDISKNPTKPNPSDEIFTVSKTGITFKKDYTGTINLLLEVLFTNGTSYSVNWEIKVFGILKVDPSIKTFDGDLSNGTGYNSGDKVDLLNDTSGGSTGLHLIDMKSYLNDSNLVNYSNIKTTINYSIVKYNSTDGKSNEERYKSATAKNELTNSAEAQDKKYEATLPVVPSVLPGSTERYLVIYKVDITYLGRTLDSYYVAYRTVNFLNISVVNEEYDIDGSSATTGDIVKLTGNNINVKTRLSGIYLDLFGYTETYTDGTDTYKIWLYSIINGQPKYKAKKNSEADAKDIEITNSSESEKLTFTYDGSSIPATRQSKENYYKKVDGNNINIYSMFTLTFDNIAEFGNFVSTIGYVEINNYKFNLTHISDDRWGINLANKYKSIDADGNLTSQDTTNMLFNNKLEDSDFVIRSKDGQPIYTLKSYNDLPENGFRMHTSTILSAKGSKLISDLFVAENVTGWSTVENYEIVGVYGGTGTGAISSPQSKWVTNATSAGTPNNVAGVEIKVPTGTGSYITYTLQEVEYSGSGGVTGVCDVKQKFHVLHCADHAAVYRMNANTTNMIKYNQGQDTIVDLSDIFVKFANNTATGKLEIVSASVTEMKDESKNVHTGLTDYKLTITGNKITMAESDLITYKNANPTKTYVTVYYTATFDDITLKCGLTYQLPSTTT